jgi:nicastrin
MYMACINTHVRLSRMQGANAPLSGLVAMLAALHALSSAAPATDTFSKQLVFLALAGEPWGYMGSRRLLYEAASGSNATAGLDLSLVEQVGGMCLTQLEVPSRAVLRWM